MLTWGISIYKSPSSYFRSSFGLHSSWANKDWTKPLYLEILFFTAFLRDWHVRQFLISPVDIKAQTKNPRKRNSPLNTCVGGIRLEGCMLYLTYKLTDTCYLLHSTCIMHTCIAYSSCIILTPYFAAIIDSSRSSCVWERKVVDWSEPIQVWNP